MDWWIYTIIGVVVIIVLIVALVLIIKSGRNKKNESVSAQQSAPVADKEDQDNVVEKQSVEEETAPVAEEQEVEVEVEEQEETAEEEEEAKEVEVESTEKGKKTTKSYHVSKRKSDGMWQIKLAGGKKAIKLFRTQQEAIDYCKVLAEKQEANLTVHKKDGSFRKKNY